MLTTRRLLTLLIALLLAGLSGPAHAQDTTPLVLGQPVSVTIASAGETAHLSYTLDASAAISLLAISETAQPTLALLREGDVVAAHANAESALNITLDTYLPAGAYEVEVGAANGTTGTIFVILQSETPITPEPLAVATPVQGAVNEQTPLAIYTFAALPEPAYLYADSLLPETGVEAHLRNLTTGSVSAVLGADLLGARLSIPAGEADYQLELAYDGQSADQPFSLCFSPASADACGGAPVPPTPATAEAQPPAVCTVTPGAAGGVNIRQTISVDAPVVFVLPGGATADVIGISPDGMWYQISYFGVTGWAALSVVTASGDCSALPVVTPPAIPAAPAPTQPPAPAPTQPPTPTMPPVPTAPPTASGPCLVTFTADELYYTQPEMLPDYIFDQISSGGELIMVGRWNTNPSWYKTSTGMWWPNAVGTSAVLSGGCDSLPLVSWP